MSEVGVGSLPEPIATATATSAAIAAVPSIPHRDDAPVFQAPWEAEAFAMVLALHERQVFSWTEWASVLADAIFQAQQEGDPDIGDTYYLHWLSALENIVLAKGVGAPDQLQGLAEAWRQAALTTPHGMPIELTLEKSSKLFK